GTLTLDGTSITTTSFDRTLGTFNHNDGTLTISGGAYTQSPGTVIVNGNTATAQPTLVFAAGATTSGITQLILGDTQHGNLTVTGGSTLSNSGSVTVGQTGAGA